MGQHTTAGGGRPRIGVSSCLLGEEVRYNGGHKRDRFLADELGPHVEWVTCCPEMAIGLGTPRETLRLTADGRLVNRSGTADHTAAVNALPLLDGLDGYVFKAKSPSCGIHGIPRYPPDREPAHGQPADGPPEDGRRTDGGRTDGQPVDREGRGLFAGRMMAAYPGLPVEDEGRLNDAALREAFTERVFAAARLRGLFAGPWRPRDLVEFHTRHKLQMLAHDPARYREAGRIVADAVRGPRAETEAAYREVFGAALAAKATRGRHTNALQHAFSLISDGLDDARRHDILDRIDGYRHGLVPLSVPVTLLSHHAHGDGLEWLAGQTYLNPFPPSLCLRHTI